MGDFNINLIEGNQRILTVVSNYRKIITEPARISSSLIDHVYTLNGFRESVNKTSEIMAVHFIDHEGGRFCICNKRCE